MRYNLIIECEDSYESEKLAAFLANQKENSNLIKSTKSRDNELIVTLIDKSSHCVVMKNRASVSNVTRIINRIIDGKAKLFVIKTEGSLLHVEYVLE